MAEISTGCFFARLASFDVGDVFDGIGQHYANQTIVIDPDGGGAEPQGTGPTGLRGADINRGVAEELARLLAAAGAVHMTLWHSLPMSTLLLAPAAVVPLAGFSVTQISAAMVWNSAMEAL